MNKTTSQKIRLGIFVITGLSFFVLAAYLIGNQQNLFQKSFKISAKFNNVNGLQLGNNVRYSGINVGTVKKIEMLNDSVIIVDMSIEKKIIHHIKKDAVAAIGSDGLVGSMIVNIFPGNGMEEVVSSGDTIRSYSRIGAEDMLTTLSVTNENAAILTADLLKITNAINSGKGTVGMLINDPEVADGLKETVFNLKTASREVISSVKVLNNFIVSINNEESVAAVLLKDSIAGNQLKNIINNLDNSGKKLSEVTENMNTILVNMKEGEGTVNYLTNDKKLVSDLDETINNIKEGTRKFNENMEALKHNFLFRRYFKKQEKEKKKQIDNQ
ncbi:MlaD family protein [Abyssalbus ytuae]|uniref:MlaD family protein n=1 Tax=Abyssalbus ytuae TaxID=2926907 RepID=A0A9E7CZW8_9FLAO|nr:MlaD family protein [Abyssalbus ytuae]UOB17935.1 MlaD family protein [Abyssalbus ytuae]